ncbi:MAG TPA: hypothetical protein VGE21_02655 [Flavobacteriales bacterium]
MMSFKEIIEKARAALKAEKEVKPAEVAPAAVPAVEPVETKLAEQEAPVADAPSTADLESIATALAAIEEKVNGLAADVEALKNGASEVAAKNEEFKAEFSKKIEQIGAQPSGEPVTVALKKVEFKPSGNPVLDGVRKRLQSK